MEYPKSFTYEVKGNKAAVKLPTVWGKELEICQTCRFQHNRPSTCKLTDIPVPRKQEGCKKWRKK